MTEKLDIIPASAVVTGGGFEAEEGGEEESVPTSCFVEESTTGATHCLFAGGFLSEYGEAVAMAPLAFGVPAVSEVLCGWLFMAGNGGRKGDGALRWAVYWIRA